MVDNRSYQVQDATPAALVTLFAQHGRLACVTAEGHEVFQTITGARFSSSKSADPMGSDLNVILEAYDNNPVRVDRVGRDVKEAGRAALSILLAVQPEVLDQAVRNSALMQRGLLDRFCFVRAQSAGPQMRSPDDRPRPIPASVSTAYAVELKRMCDVPGGTVIKASPEAERLWFEYKYKLDPRRPESGLSDLRGWAVKHAYRAARLAGILAVASGENEVSAATMSNAIQVCDWFLAHARQTFGIAPEHEIVDSVARFAREHGGQVSSRAVLRQFRRTIPNLEALNAVLTLGAALERLRVEAGPKGGFIISEAN